MVQPRAAGRHRRRFCGTDRSAGRNDREQYVRRSRGNPEAARSSTSVRSSRYCRATTGVAYRSRTVRCASAPIAARRSGLSVRHVSAATHSCGVRATNPPPKCSIASTYDGCGLATAGNPTAIPSEICTRCVSRSRRRNFGEMMTSDKATSAYASRKTAGTRAARTGPPRTWR
jgi:hypothetical protein